MWRICLISILPPQAYNGHCEALHSLCETLVSLDVRDIEGRTALHLAAQRGFAQCVEELLKHQASCTLKEPKHKWTALHAAGECVCERIKPQTLKLRRFSNKSCCNMLSVAQISMLVFHSCEPFPAAEGQVDCVLLLVNREDSAEITDSPDSHGRWVKTYFLLWNVTIDQSGKHERFSAFSHSIANFEDTIYMCVWFHLIPTCLILTSTQEHNSGYKYVL